MGTPQYMAPEQIEHPLQVDHRADIYSLGVVFYQMLTGELPIGRFAPPSKKVQIDVRLDEVVLRALEKEPERRYQQASEMKTPRRDDRHHAAGPRVRTNDIRAADAARISFDRRALAMGGYGGHASWNDLHIFAGTLVANASALGFLGFLACWAFVPLPGMQRCFGFSGFFGFFGLIGVACHY